MPIVYETQAPIESAAAVAELQQQNDARELAARRLASDASRGGGVMPGGGVYDTGLQQAVFARNDQSFQREADSLNRTGITNQSLAQARWQMEAQTQAEVAARQQQQERFKLQAWLNEQELTQQERIRLTRMQNSVQEVQADPTWTPEEKQAIIAKLKTGIDPLHERAARAAMAAETKMKQAHADQYQLQASLEKQRLDIMARTADDRTTFHPDPTALAAITEDLRAHLGPAAAHVSDEQLAKLAKAEAIRQGLGTHAYLQPDGKLVPFAGESAGRGKPGDPADENGMTVKTYIATLNSVVRQIDARAKETVKKEDGTTAPRWPDLHQNEQAQYDAVKLRMQAMGLPPTLAEFQATLSQPDTGGRKAFDPQKASYRKGQEAPRAASDATQVTPGKAAPVAFRLSDLDDEGDKLQKAEIPQGDKTAANVLIGKAKGIIQAHPDPATRPAAATEELKKLAGQLSPILEKARAAAGAKKVGVTGPYGIPVENLTKPATLGESW